MEFEPDFVDNESRFASEPHGRFHIWLPDGTWTLRFSEPAHLPQTVEVEVVNGETRELEIELMDWVQEAPVEGGEGSVPAKAALL